MRTEHKIFIGLGSNIDPERNLRLALAKLVDHYGPVRRSAAYRNPAVGFDGDPFINLVARAKTTESPRQVHRQLKAIEAAAGRAPHQRRHDARKIDLDLLLYDDIALSCDELTVPRGDILEYAFVLKPLAELVPGYRHPLTGRSLADHWLWFRQEHQTYQMEKTDL